MVFDERALKAGGHANTINHSCRVIELPSAPGAAGLQPEETAIVTALTKDCRIDLTDNFGSACAVQAEATHRMNEAIQRAVAAGVSTTLVRVSLLQDGHGGDQVWPMIRGAEALESAGA